MPPQQPNNWIVIPKPNPAAQVKLFCLPFAGGSTVAFRSWGNLLPDFIEVNAVEIPGRGHRLTEPLIKVLENLVYNTAKGIIEQIDRPYVLFGHSMGSLLGFELAHYLTEHHGRPPLHLVFSGRGAPHVTSKEKPIHELPESDFIREIKNYNGTPKEVLEHSELMQIMIPILRSDFQVCETYTYKKHMRKLNSPISVFGGLNDHSAPRSELEAWKEHTTGAFNLRMFPGDHFYLNSSEKMLLEALARDVHVSMKEAKAGHENG